MFGDARALVLMLNFVEIDRAAAEVGGRIAAEGADIAREAGLNAEPVAVESPEPSGRRSSRSLTDIRPR